MNERTKKISPDIVKQENANNQNQDKIENFLDTGAKIMEEEKCISQLADDHISKYTPGRGLHRYNNSLKNLIPFRKKMKEQEAIPIDNADLFSTLSFTWISKYIYKAHRKGLTMEELPSVSPYDKCDYNVQRLELLWKEELAKVGHKQASLMRVAWRFSRTRMFAATFVFTCHLFFGFSSSTILMRHLLEHIQSGNGSYLEGTKWALLLTMSEFLRSLLLSWTCAISYRTALRLRLACCTLVYRKILEWNNLGNSSIGEVVNIFSNDAQRIYDVVLFTPMMIAGPLTIIWGICYILQILSPMALMGMLMFFLYYPLQYVISYVTGYLLTKSVKISDMRVRLTTDILERIKLIKMYAWEKYFNKELLDLRKKEQRYLLNTACCHSLSLSLVPAVPIISSIASISAHISAGHNLTAAQAFPLSTFFGFYVRLALTRLKDGSQMLVESIVAFRRIKVFPYISLLDSRLRVSLSSFQYGVECLISAGISFNRLKSVLLLEDSGCSISKPILNTQAVAISHGTFACNTFDNRVKEKSRTNDEKRKNARRDVGDKSEKEKLNKVIENVEHVEILFDISFEITKGKLVGICGPVGSGKTSLLLAALGQLRISEGQVMRDGSCAYVSQQAWITNASLRDNILFGAPFDNDRYNKAIYASNLSQDIEMMPGGDQEEIGENGVNLSGGQKQRVALARALYADRDIYFLDDPLSAVDARVGAHIFDNYILGALRGKTVLFVTHQIHYLDRCDEIYMMRDGRIVDRGIHDELMKLSSEYALMVATISAASETENSVFTHKKIEARPESANNSQDCIKNKNSTIEATSNVSTGHNKTTSGGKQTVAEDIQQGTIKAQIYHSYIMAAGGYFFFFIVLLTFLLVTGSNAFSSWWLATWIRAGGGNTTIVRNNVTVLSENLNDNPDFWFYQSIYVSMIAVILVMSALRSLVFTKATIGAATKLHNSLFKKIVNSPMRFFETTPIGRIQHLFSRDLNEVDSRLPLTLGSLLQNMCVIFFATLIICTVFPWIILPFFVFSCLYYLISKVYRTAASILKRLENKSRGQVIGFVTAAIQGLNTIHAFGKEADFIRKFNEFSDGNGQCLFMNDIAMRWLALRIDTLSIMITAATAFLIIALQNQVSPALAGLALSYSAYVSGVLQYTVRLMSEAEVKFISVERINHYLRTLVSEVSTKQSTIQLPPTWPSLPKVEFKNVSMKYRDDTPLILKNISFDVNAGEKIGIVGRTGSGKSSLTVALFRLVELAEGKIEIDDVDISQISLEQLRTKLSIIPQDPTLFSGTIRSNLDPFKLHTDAEIWKVLEKTQLRTRIQSVNGQLDASVGSGGETLSVGEKQLLCLTRALLRDTKILILDEATAAVDPETEINIQTTIQQEFSNCTILVIAHRLQTVLPLNRVLVIGNGKVLEYDTPTKLLDDQNSEFSKMIAAAEQAHNQ